MMGGDQAKGAAGVKRFCGILQRLLDKEGFDIEVRPILDSYNGAKNKTGDYDAHIPEFVWNDAMDEYLA